MWQYRNIRFEEFDTEEECRKEAEKIIRSKINKGYVEDETLILPTDCILTMKSTD